jgi:hypothetical protein
MAVANRSTRLRRLAADLTQQFGLPWGPRGIQPEYDEIRREWTYAWPDGPTVEQVRRAARKAQPEAAKGLLYRRDLSDTAQVLGVLRMALAAQQPLNEDFRGPHIPLHEIHKFLSTMKNPAPKNGREATIVANLLKLSEKHGHSGWRDAGEKAAEFVATYGFTQALADVELTPLEVLTSRYAQGPAERAWRFRLVPMTVLEAFSAVQADPAAQPDAIDTALTLLPELHAALDQAAADLKERLGGPDRELQEEE